MDAADARIPDGRPILPSYDELQRENADLKRQLVAAREEIQGLRRTVDQRRQRVEELLRQIEQLRGESKRQAAPFRKHDEPPAEPKKPGRKPGGVMVAMPIAKRRRASTRRTTCRCHANALIVAAAD
ncbi:MAG TPA: hypothetical protein VHX86_14510 [Tepidisphaeraceae bacterium]|jgi:cell division septum initiation protein DivIVA|nr:hypothetical protein [Tepidisphaeraceae bacterium]